MEKKKNQKKKKKSRSMVDNEKNNVDGFVFLEKETGRKFKVKEDCALKKGEIRIGD